MQATRVVKVHTHRDTSGSQQADKQLHKLNMSTAARCTCSFASVFTSAAAFHEKEAGNCGSLHGLTLCCAWRQQIHTPLQTRTRRRADGCQ
jgi:hypothetical protein